tara:strand:+ start:87 stop:914 length:828 start_codon:yes stop_codon:yes gene_type:complete
MKLRHNKKRNTAFLYEALIREVAKSVISKDVERKKSILSIIKEHFSAGSVLTKEIKLYKNLHETRRLDIYTAERLIHESKSDHSRLNKEHIFESQTRLINIINKKLGSDVFANFVPSYKSLATISQVFGEDVDTKERVLLERKLIGTMVIREGAPPKLNKMPHIDGLVYNTFVKKFNDKYDSQLLPEQKKLLNLYLTSFSNNGIEFKVFLGEEINRLKSKISMITEDKEGSMGDDIKRKTKAVLEKLEKFKKTKIDNEVIQGVLKMQSLASETSS